MWKGILITIIIASIVGSHYVFAKPDVGFTQLDKINHALRESIVQHEPELALDQLAHLKKDILATDLSKAGSIRGFRLLFDAMEQLDRQLHAVKPNFAQISQLGNRVYFSVDALSHIRQPAWLTVEQAFRRHLQEWRVALHSNSSSVARQQWVHLWALWQQIEPAAWMQASPSTMEKVHAWMEAVNREMRMKLNYARLTTLLHHEKSVIDDLFHHAQPTLQMSAVTSSMPHLGWQLPASISAIILSMLSVIAIYTRRKPYISRFKRTEAK